MGGLVSRKLLSSSGLGSLAFAICLTAGSGTAWAQEAPVDTPAPGTPEPQPQADVDGTSTTDNEIIVTGSRVGRSTFTTISPITVLNSEDIERLNLNDVGEIVAQLPSNSNFFAANNVGLGNFNVGAQLVNLRGLNPFFGTRTLTLVDTHRVVPTTTGGGVDVTLIPSVLVARTETVTGAPRRFTGPMPSPASSTSSSTASSMASRRKSISARPPTGTATSGTQRPPTAPALPMAAVTSSLAANTRRATISASAARSATGAASGMRCSPIPITRPTGSRITSSDRTPLRPTPA